MGEVDRRLQELREKEVEISRHLREIGPGSTSGGMSDDWKASVDRQLTQLHQDVRHLLFGLIGGFLFLITAGGAAFAQLSGSIGTVRKEMSDFRVEVVTSSSKLDARLEAIDRKLDEQAKRSAQ